MEKAYTMAEEPYTRIYARIDLDAIVKNMEAMRENLPAKTKMIGVVKTDGYGHGAVPVAKTIAPFVWGYAVATLEEGQNLRRHGIDKPILVLGSTHPRHFAELIEGDIRPAIFEEDKAELLSKLAVSMGKTAKMHIALDTGMGRIGFHPDENSLKEIERIAKLPGIEIEGMFTHFARADEADKAFTHLQYDRYQKFHEGLENAGVHIPMCHCANSAAIMELPRMGLDIRKRYRHFSTASVLHLPQKIPTVTVHRTARQLVRRVHSLVWNPCSPSTAARANSSTVSAVLRALRRWSLEAAW